MNDVIKLIDYKEYAWIYEREEYKVVERNEKVDIYQRKENSFEKLDPENYIVKVWMNFGVPQESCPNVKEYFKKASPKCKKEIIDDYWKSLHLR